MTARPGKTPKFDEKKKIDNRWTHGRESVLSEEMFKITKFQNCMECIRAKETLMECGNISILFINDFDKGFTPVLECEIANLKMINNEDFNDENSEI